jgi:hypothetical protein
VIKVWTIGREREKLHAANFVRKPEDQAILFPVIDAVEDLKEGTGTIAQFLSAARTAMVDGGYGAWTNASNWIAKVAKDAPEVLKLWDELSNHPEWKVRWRVACGLYYFGIGEDQSNRLFVKLRNDKSKKVREYAISRYEHRPNPKNIEKIYDAADFDGRVSRGEVTI